MALILGIETATEVCSVSLFENDIILLTIDEQKEARHIAALHPAIEKLMSTCGKGFSQLDAVAVSSGPGSYTGLRIGVSAAKGICYALDKPLIAVETLLSMVYGMKKNVMDTVPGSLFLPMIDARRMDVYMAVYDTDLNIVESVEAVSIDENSFEKYPNQKIIIGGNACAKLENMNFRGNEVVFITTGIHSAANMHQPAITRFSAQNFEDTAYFEPFYLKDFIPGKPKVKGLR